MLQVFPARLRVIVVLLLAILSLGACQRDQPGLTAVPSAAIPLTPDQTLAPEPIPTDTASPSETPAPVASHLNIQPEQLRGTIIHFWYPWTGASGQVMRSLADEFNLNNEWGIVVVPVAQKGLDGIDSELGSARRTGELPDLAAGYLYQLMDWDRIQPLVDLQEYVNDPAWGFTSQEQADFTPVFWEHDVLDGRRLGVPIQRSAQVLYYNASWAQALGFSAPPVTPEHFRQQVCEAAWANRSGANTEIYGTGGWIVSTNYASALSWIFSFGGGVVEPPVSEDKPYQFNTPQADEAFAFLRDLYDTNCAWVSEDSDPEAQFARRLGLISTGSVMDIPYQVQAFQRAGNADQWRIIAYPSKLQKPAIAAYGASLAVFPSSPQQQLAAWQLARWLLEPRNHARFVEASGSFPVRGAELAYLEGYRQRYPQWGQALELIPSARSEPTVSSWGQVRFALSDAFTQLFRSYFSLDQIQTMLNYLDKTANDLHIGPEASGVFNTPTPSPLPPATSTRTQMPPSEALLTNTALPTPIKPQSP